MVDRVAQSELPRVNHFLPGPVCVYWAFPWDLHKTERPNDKRDFSLLSPALIHSCTHLFSLLIHAIIRSLANMFLEKEGFYTFFFCKKGVHR